ncbi:S-layer homology domain-containing protein [Cohnella soli]|uniref:S-layer homology domain-containing protein n=1 Tax=Cohnella soli TaxID=425005 RepID=A0ABW0HY94_9BACL
MNGTKRIAVSPGRQLKFMLSGLLLVLSLLSPLAGKVAYAARDPLSGEGTEENPWKITKAADLHAIGQGDYLWSGHYLLVNDIILTYDFYPIGFGDDSGFSGTFDGNGKKISGLQINRPDDDNVGLFSKIENGHVFDLTVETGNGGIIGHDNVGIIAGLMEQTEEDSWASLMFVSAKGDVKGNKNVGGLVGSASGVDDNSNLVFAYNHMGRGTVTGANSVGGLAGFLMTGTVYNSHAEAAVTGGGLDPDEIGDSMGGLLGYADDAQILRSYSTGTVGSTIFTIDNIGGLIGASSNSKIYHSYSTSNIIGTRFVGGLMGFSFEDFVQNSYAAGYVGTTFGPANGLIGINYNELSNVIASYWDTQASGQPDGDVSDAHLYGIGRNTNQMKNKATFTSDSEDEDNNWDFEHVWYMENGRYPQLYAGMDIRFNMEPLYVSVKNVSEQNIQINMDSRSLGYGHRISVYRADNNDTPVDTFHAGTYASASFTLHTSGINDGWHELDDGYYFVNQYGNRTSVFYPRIFIDSTSPVWGNDASITQDEDSAGDVVLSWDEATDGTGSGVRYYHMYVNGVPELNPVYGTTYTLTAPSTSAAYEVEAVDWAGNKSTTRLSIGGTPSTTSVSGTRNVVIGTMNIPSYTATVLGAPSYMQPPFSSSVYGGTLTFYVDGVVKTDNVQLSSVISALPPYGMFPLNNYNDLTEGVHTLKAVYSGYSGNFHGTDYKVNPSEGTFDITVSGLNVTSSDPSGAENDGKTKLVVAPAVTTGHKLVYRNFGSSDVIVPNIGDVLDLTDYTDLPEGGIVSATSFDKIGVVELDTGTGKVIHIGQTFAIVMNEPEGPGAATGLTVTSSDPSGAANDGMTKLTVTPGATTGHKLVYRNFESGNVIVPNVDEVLTGYANLPAEGLIPAANGDKIGVAEVDTLTGKVVRFGQTTAVVAAEPPVITPGPSTSIPVTNDIEVLVNGKVENLGKSKTSEFGGVKTTTVTIDPVKLQAKLDAEGSHAVVTIPVKTAADSIIGELNGQIVKSMEKASATLVLQTEKATYTLPAQQINIDALSEKLGKSVALADIKVQIEIAVPAADQIKWVENAAAKGTFTLVAPPVEFTVRGTYGDKTVEVTHFNAYVERTIAIPEGVDPSKITTGVVVDPDGTVRHVPTKVVVIDGKSYVKINSLTNSTYSVVWHPLEFADMTKHWAKDAVNDMGSRMVIEGTGNGQFSPDRTITRAEFAVIVVRGLGLKLESGASAFPDVKASDWYGSAVNTAVKYGLISGFEDGTFRPNEQITREQAMSIIAKAMKVTGLKGKLPAQSVDAVLRSFADAAAASNWAKNGIADSVQAGIVSGRGEAGLAPKAFVTRAEVAMMVRNLLQKSDLI